MAFLSVERGNEKGRRIELTPGKTVVFGRDPDCDVVVSDHLCAPRHFEAYEKDGAFWVRDLGSEEGTKVNESRISSKYKLRPGDLIHVGETQFAFAAAEASKEAARTIGGYRLLERIGKGGMGAVYKANQVSLNRIVALKLLSHRISADPNFVRRFQSEAQAAGKLNHPNIVQVYDVGFDQGLHYYSMEFIENGSVQDLATREGALDVDLALSIITDAARGLVYAEKRGIVHRDIKPDNLMVNAEGVVKIADLGLALDGGERARHAGEGSSEEEDVFGTPQFISPEQAQGLPVDTRSDIYSLGASFYRLVTGQPPFTGENIAEIVSKQINEEPVPVRKLRPDVPAAVAAVIERAMQKDPAARFQSAQAMLDALEAADAALKGGRRGLLVAAAVGALLIAGAAAWFFMRPAPAPTPPPPQPVAPVPDTRALRDAAALASAAQRERDAARALRDASDFEKEQIAGGEPDLAAIRDRYESVADRYADTPDGKDAREQAAAITARIAEAARRAEDERLAAESRATAAREAATRALDGAAALTAADRFSAALRALRAAQPGTAGTEQEAALDSAIKKTASRAEERATELVTGASNETAAATESALLTAAEAFAEGGADEAVEPLVGRLRVAASEVRLRREEKEVRDLAADAVAVDRARKAAFKAVSERFDPEALLSALDAARSSLAAEASAGALADDRGMAESMVRLRDRFASSLPADDAKGPRVKLPFPDPKRPVEYQILRADSAGLTVRRGRDETQIPYTALTAREAYDLLFEDVVAKEPALRPDAVAFLLMVGEADGALEIARQMPDGDQKTPLLARVSREREAWGLLTDVRDLTQKAQTDETALLRLYRAVTRLVNDFRDTRAYQLNRRAPGAVPAPATRPSGS